MSSRYPRFSYRGRPAGRRFGAAGYRGGVSKRRVTRRRAVPVRTAMTRYGRANFATRGYIGMGGVSEQKFKDITVNLAADTTGALVLLNGIEQGTTPSTRIGSVLRMTRIELRLQSAVTASTGVDQRHRWLLVYDRQTNGAAMTIAQLLNTTSVLSAPLLENRDRFMILADSVTALNASAESGSIRVYQKRITLSLPTVFIGGAGTADTVADIKSGSLYMVSIGSEAAGNTAGVTSGSSRVWFTDR